MLEKDPLKRIKIEEIIEHPYVRDCVSPDHISPGKESPVKQAKKFDLELHKSQLAENNPISKVTSKKLVQLELYKKQKK